MRLLSMTFLSLTALSLVAQTSPIISTQKDRQSIRLTIYQGGKAFIQEMRSVEMPKGPAILRVEGLASGIDPSTFNLQSPDFSSSLGIKRQSFLYARPTAQQLVTRFEGKLIKVAVTKGVTETLEEATLLSGDGGSIVLQFPNRVEVLGASALNRLVFPPLPPEVAAEPQIEVVLENAMIGRRPLAIAYITGDFQWAPSYSVIIKPDETQIDLTAWAKIINGSKISIDNAQVDLLSGEIPGNGGENNFVLDGLQTTDYRRGFQGSNNIAFLAPGIVSAESSFGEPSPIGVAVGEHKVYSLPSTLSLLPLQSVQVPFLEAHGIKVQKEYRLTHYFASNDAGSSEVDGVQARIEASLLFKNVESEHLGRELPGGRARLYQPDGHGVLRYLGDVQIPESVSGMTITLRLGVASDLTAKRRTTDFKVIEDPATRRSTEEKAFEVLFTNRKDEPQVVHAQVTMNGDWNLLSSSHPGTKEQAGVVGFKVQVPAKGQATLQYRIKNRPAR